MSPHVHRKSYPYKDPIPSHPPESIIIYSTIYTHTFDTLCPLDADMRAIHDVDDDIDGTQRLGA